MMVKSRFFWRFATFPRYFEDNYSIYGKSGSKLGNSIVSKDINNDFIDDLIVGAPFTKGLEDNGLGEIYVIYGSRELQAAST